MGRRDDSLGVGNMETRELTVEEGSIFKRVGGSSEIISVHCEVLL